MKELNLSFLCRDGEILLAMKKRRFGAGKWNGYGGKCDVGESIEDSAVREIEEESSVKVKKEDLNFFGTIDFYFNDKPEWNQKVFIYKVYKWEGEPVETEEMKPQWYKFEEIPWSDMWVGDDQWLPLVIQNKKIKGEVHFDEGGKKLLNVKLIEE